MSGDLLPSAIYTHGIKVTLGGLFLCIWPSYK